MENRLEAVISMPSGVFKPYTGVSTACRTAMEFAVKWVYSADQSLTRPDEDKLVTRIPRLLLKTAA